MLPAQSTKPTVGIALKVISATKELSIQNLVTQVIRVLKTQLKNTHVTRDSIALKVATSRLIALQATTARPIELTSMRNVATEPTALLNHQLL
jgi:hypothetical protein